MANLSYPVASDGGLSLPAVETVHLTLHSLPAIAVPACIHPSKLLTPFWFSAFIRLPPYLPFSHPLYLSPSSPYFLIFPLIQWRGCVTHEVASPSPYPRPPEVLSSSLSLAPPPHSSLPSQMVLPVQDMWYVCGLPPEDSPVVKQWYGLPQVCYIMLSPVCTQPCGVWLHFEE